MKKLSWITGLIVFAVCHSNGRADTACEGFRAALQAGYGVIDAELTTTQPNATPAQPGLDVSGISGRGVIGAFAIDYMSLVGNSDMIVGAELSLNFLTTKGKKSTLGTFPSAANVYTGDLSTSVFLRRAYEIVGKIGCMFKGAAVGYFRIGPSLGSWKGLTVSNTLMYQGAKVSKAMGVVIGVGAEFPVSDRVAFGAEYNYRRYPTFSFDVLDPTGTKQLNMSINPTSHAIMFRLSYKLSAVDFSTTPPKERKRKRSRKASSGG